jgi:hypothetical protein
LNFIKPHITNGLHLPKNPAGEPSAVGCGERQMKDQLREAVLQSFQSLLDGDGELFDCPIEIHADYDARKLHEVCLNHRLACHLEAHLAPLLATLGERMFVDIEFNREGVDFKNLIVIGQEKRVRPDIIVHNRRSGGNKINLLVVECKRRDAPNGMISEDRDKLRAFMEDGRYDYSFALQVLYAKAMLCGSLFFMEDGIIHSEEIEYSKPRH